MDTPFSALVKAVNIIEKYKFVSLNVNSLIYIRHDKYYNIFNLTNGLVLDKNGLVFNKDELLVYLLNFDIQTIFIYKYSYKRIFIYYKGIDIIQRMYRKYKLRTANIRNDLVIRGLSELWYHPSRISFEC